MSSLAFWRIKGLEAPKNFEAPTTYKLRRIILGGLLFCANIGEKLGYGIEPILFRNIVNKFVSFKKKELRPELEMKDGKINGVDVRIYRPVSLTDTTDAPILIYYHGGGFYFGAPSMYDEYVGALSTRLNAVAISVDYRMAPDNPFPVPTNDCYAVTKYVLESSNEFGDTNKVILAGDSAGGNIVAVMTQKLSNNGVKSPKFQILIYPWMQMFTNRLPSHIKYGKTNFKTGEAVAYYFGLTDKRLKAGSIITYNHHTLLIDDENMRKKLMSYTDPALIPEKYKDGCDYYEDYNWHETFPKESDRLKNVTKDKNIVENLKKIFTDEVSPGLADSEKLKNLPDAYFVIVETDPLKDEGLIYSERLRAAGVKTHVAFYDNAYHGLSQMVDKKEGYNVSRVMLDDLVEHIKNYVI